jgi:hypothetical protein
MFHEIRPVTGNQAHIFTITLLFVALAGGGFYGLLSALETGDRRWLALFLTCAAGVIVAAWRVKQHDARAFVEREGLATKPPAQPGPDVQTVRVFSHVSNGGNLVAVGRFSFSPEQWHALKTAVYEAGGKLIRDKIRAARPFIFDPADIGDWKSIVAEFQRLQLVDEKQMLTSAGREFFRRDPFSRRDFSPTPAAVNGEYEPL